MQRIVEHGEEVRCACRHMINRSITTGAFFFLCNANVLVIMAPSSVEEEASWRVRSAADPACSPLKI